MPDNSQPHSADQFGAERDFWWHRDFLDLMARRWRLREASSLADIGCGLCHWSRLLYPYLRAPARFAAVDRENRWVSGAEQHFERQFPHVSKDLLIFAQGDATAIPLPDDAFEVVTCQTVLMHLAQPLDALREMFRILRPGGLLICVEPNNFWNYLAFTSLTAEQPIERLVQQFEFWLRVHRGRIAAGQGNDSVGDLLPGYFAQLGLKGISVHQSDRAGSIFPPYETPEQKASLEQQQQWRNSASGPWNREELRRFCLLGGATEKEFERGFNELASEFQREQEAIKAGRFHAAYGGLTYLVSGRKGSV